MCGDAHPICLTFIPFVCHIRGEFSPGPPSVPGVDQRLLLSTSTFCFIFHLDLLSLVFHRSYTVWFAGYISPFLISLSSDNFTTHSGDVTQLAIIKFCKRDFLSNNGHSYSFRNFYSKTFSRNIYSFSDWFILQFRLPYMRTNFTSCFI